MSDVSEHARMVPMLPCSDIDQLAAFWTALGLRVTYRQVRSNPYLALRRNAIELHYYPMGGPRITRPRQRANNAGLSGFRVVDPAGNWIRVSRRPDDAHQPRSIDERTEWVSTGGGPLARALENAVVVADSHGDEGQAQRILAGAVARHPGATVAERAGALAYLAELRVRVNDMADAQEAATEVTRLAHTTVPPQDREALDRAVREVGDLPIVME